jgi:hypothetical protein
MTMKVTFEGTPEELARAFPNLMSSAALAEKLAGNKSGVEPGAAPGIPVEATLDGFVTVDVAHLVLTRLPVAPEQLLVLRELYAAHPARISTSDLAAKVGYSKAQFTGLMGAFGRRVANTQGLVAGMAFFDKKWVDGSIAYALPETVREAMRHAKLV